VCLHVSMHVTYPLSLSLGLNQVLNPKSRDHHPQNQTHTPIARKQTTLINSLNTRTTTFIHLRLAHDALSSGVRQTDGAHLAEIACGCPEVTPTVRPPRKPYHQLFCSVGVSYSERARAVLNADYEETIGEIVSHLERQSSAQAEMHDV
jgi:hypothetical protein